MYRKKLCYIYAFLNCNVGLKVSICHYKNDSWKFYFLLFAHMRYS